MQTEKEFVTKREISSLRFESVGEYSLPDYNGDVKKVLAVNAKVFPAGKFVGDETMEFSGSVGYEVVYIDGENSVTHAEFSTDYDAAVKINAETYCDSDVCTCVSSCNLRLVGPRKLSVKCSLDSNVRIGERRTYGIGGDAFDEYEPEVLTSVANVIEPVFASGEAKELGDELVRLDGAIADEVDVLLSDARFEKDTFEAGDDSVSLKGRIVVSALIKNADDTPTLVVKEISYSDEVELTGAGLLASIEPRVDMSLLKTVVTPTEEGVSIGVSVGASTKIYGEKNCALQLVGDSFLKERGTSNEYSEFGYTEHICTGSKSDSFEVKRALSELGIENIGDVIYADGQARVESTEIGENGAIIQGEMRFSGIACQVLEDGEKIYSPIKFTAPFTQNVNLNCQIHDNMRLNCTSHLSDVKMDIDENNVSASATVTSFVTVNSQKRQRCLGSSYLTDEEYSKDDSVLTVYYPDSSESLFSIAKRFHTSVYEIAEANRLTESVFASYDAPIGNSGVTKLLIK